MKTTTLRRHHPSTKEGEGEDIKIEVSK